MLYSQLEIANPPRRYSMPIDTHKPRILVTSAAGRTGAPAVLDLLRRGFPVRAFVRQDDARAAVLRKAGAEIFVGNLFDWRDLRRAMVDVQRAYHCPPYAPNLLHGSMLFALAAEEGKLEAVALMSQWNPHPAHPVPVTREHWMVNNLYQWMPSVDVIYVNPGLFAFAYLLALPAILHLGMLAGPFGEGLNAPPSNEDIGRVAAGVLANPGPHLGKMYRPTGPDLLSPSDIAGILSRVVGRKVTYRDVPTGMFLKAATAQGFPKFEIHGIRTYAEELKGGTFAIGAPTSHVEEITGHPAESFESIARRYVAQPDLIVPGLRVGGKLGALGFAAKMMLTPTPDLDAWADERAFPTIREPVLAHDDPTWRDAASKGRLVIDLPVSGPKRRAVA